MPQNEGEVDFEGSFTTLILPTLIKINGVDVTTTCVSWEYETTFGDLLSEIVLKFVRSVNSSVTLVAGQLLEVWAVRSDPNTLEKIFWGYVEKFEPEGGFVTVTGIDKMWDLVRKEVNHNYDYTVDASAGKISEIFKDLVTTYGGMSATAATIQDSGTGIILQKFKCNHTDVFERCKKLAEVLDWQFYYRSDTDLVYFEPKGFTNSSSILTVGSNVIQVPKWQYDITQMANNVTIVGATQDVETTEIGRIGTTSGYTTASVQLTFIPVSIKIYFDASNPPITLLVGGVVNSTSTFDYYVDPVLKQAIPAPTTTFTNGNYMQILYAYSVPVPVNKKNQVSIDTYGLFQKTVTYTDIVNVADAENRLDNYLTIYSTPFLYSTLKVIRGGTLGLRVGQNIQIVDSVSRPNVNEFMTINKLRIRYPADYDELEVGDQYWRLAMFQTNVTEALKRLNEDEFNNQDILTQLQDIAAGETDPVVVKPRYQKVLTQTPTGASLFIIGSSQYGIMGTNKLGNAQIGAETNAWVMQYLNSYSETFFDKDFDDTVNTTATWNTATPALTFTSGQVGQSLSVDYGNGTITTATITVTKTSGTFTIALSADGGSHWETCTSGVAHPFTNTGTDLRWKITEAAASTGTITAIAIASYH